MTKPTELEDLLRRSVPQVLGALVRRYGRFDICEDAVQEALLAAAVQWPEEGVPESPDRMADHRGIAPDRRRAAQRSCAAASRGESRLPTSAATRQPVDADDTLTLLFLCAHPALTPASQVALDAARGRRAHDR